MSPRNIIKGQPVNPVKAQRARQLRREMTPEERILWEHLRARRLNGLKFRRQQVIEGFIVDFYCHTAGVVVEIDGPVHRFQADYDAERDRVLTARGLRILHVTNAEIGERLPEVLERIARVCGDLTPSSCPLPLSQRERGRGLGGGGEVKPRPQAVHPPYGSRG